MSYVPYTSPPHPTFPREGGRRKFLRGVPMYYASMSRKRGMTFSTVWPSARAVKLSAMRCLKTGTTRAATSSTDGDSRPCNRARALAPSIRAWLARGET